MKNILSLISLLALMSLISISRAASLTPGKPVELAGTHGKFDFIKIDAPRRRLLACHTGNGSLDVIDIDSANLIKSVATGAAQGVAIDEKNGRYFVSVSKPPKLVIIDSAKLEVIGEVPLPEAADLVAYSSALHRVFVDDDEKPKMWLIDPETKAIDSTIAFPGAGMEDFCFDPGELLLAQNLKETSQLAWVSPQGKIIKLESTSPAEKPHGLVRIGDEDTLLVAGGIGKLVMMDLISGKVLASADTAQRVDEIAYDLGLQRVYCASGLGMISVVSVGKNALKALDAIPSSPGAHSIAVDPKTHTVWIAFAKGNQAFVQPCAATASGD